MHESQGATHSLQRGLRFILSIVIAAGFIWFLPESVGGTGGTQIAAAASDPVIAAAGDIACDPTNASFNGGQGSSSNCRQKYTSDLLVNAGLSALLDLGDNQYYCAGYQAFLQSYDLSWGRLKSITHPSVGNHEYLTSGGTGCDSTNAGAAGYFNYFGSAAGTPGQGYYSFDVGTWHIIALNSNCTDAGGCSSSSPQYKWLQADLAAHTNFCTLAYWHIPLFSSGGHAAANSQSFWQLLYNNDADLILNGHDHIYERFAPQSPSGVLDTARGIRELIIGTGGADHTSIATIAANSELRNASTYGALKLTLHPTSYDWQFVPEAGKTFTDSGTGACHGSSGLPTPTSTSTFTATPIRTVAATALSTATPGQSQSALFTPVADTYVNSASPATNYGSLTTLRADGSPDVHSYLRFSVQGLAGRPITRARLLIFANSATGSGISAKAVSDNTWGELTTNFNNAPALGSTLASSGAVTTGTWVTLDVTSYVTTEGTYSFGVITPGATAISMASREIGRERAPTHLGPRRAHRHANGNQYIYLDTDLDGHFDRDQYSHAHIDQYCNLNGYFHVDQYAEPHTDRYRDFDGYKHRYVHAHGYGYVNTNIHADQYRNVNACKHVYAHVDFNSHIHCNFYSYCLAYVDGKQYPHIYTDGYPACIVNSDEYANRDKYLRSNLHLYRHADPHAHRSGSRNIDIHRYPDANRYGSRYVHIHQHAYAD